jgi:hypothetical protein
MNILCKFGIHKYRMKLVMLVRMVEAGAFWLDALICVRCGSIKDRDQLRDQIRGMLPEYAKHGYKVDLHPDPGLGLKVPDGGNEC